MQPIELADQIEGRYRRYLETTFYFRDPELRRSFKDALSAGHLSKGPYLEGTPVFKRAQTPAALFPTLLGSQPDDGFLQAVEGRRPLYWHQEKAIRKVSSGRNTLVATGTASGKTEAFIYPILLDLYREFLAAGSLNPGVRALILYPMNALANDQRDRLGEIRKSLQKGNSRFEFTFGQYIGETPEDENDSRRHAGDLRANRLLGELVLRSEIRDKPPHILLTNYSMLEYLLLRPYDSPLFDGGGARRWKFLVLDEAHQYRGSRGIEMAMLLRRLKRRLREGGRLGPFLCMATSATLAGGEGDRTGVAEFASELFGESFEQEDVILGQTEAIPEPGPSFLSLPDYDFLREILSAGNGEDRVHVEELGSKLGAPLPSDEPVARRVGRLLQRDSRAERLRRLITIGAEELPSVASVADNVFDDLPAEARVSALSGLVRLLLQAQDPDSHAPLLSARYHLFLRSLEGAFVAYWPRKQVFLDRRTEGGGAAFEVALCRECGQHYFVGPKNFKGGKLLEAIRDPSHSDFGATFFRPVEHVPDEGDEDEVDPDSRGNSFRLCVQCGELGRGTLNCGHAVVITVVQEERAPGEDRADQMARCGACGYSAAGRDPVREVVYGADGPHAVIATTLYRTLPEGRKKVLAFADGRQEAAFFAWYLEDSYGDILSRNLVLKATERLSSGVPEGLSLEELATCLRDLFKEKKVFPPAMGDLELRRRAWLALYRELLTDEPRISLEGVGLTRWAVRWPDWFEVPTVFGNAPWSLSQLEARHLTSGLFDSMRTDRAVELRTEGGVLLNWSDLGLQSSQMRVGIGLPKQRQGVRSWDGKTGKRTHFLTRLLLRMHPEFPADQATQEAIRALRDVWEHARHCDENAPSSRDRLLISVEDARRLNPEWWRLQLIPNVGVVFQCDTCGRLQTVSIRAVCSRHRCPGTLKEVRRGDLQPNHYRSLYEEDLPGSMRVEEHTAQLDKETAREFQRDFKSGKINVLSSSTTFELGVDLGDLDTIFLRNVPPEAFNYTQRVGRAGRRTGHPGFAITYCRRSPHDLYHFAKPELMLSGKVRPPVLRVRNDKIITRHIAATALSRFFRHLAERFQSVEKLFNDLASPSGAADFTAFLNAHRGEIEESLRAIVPPDMSVQVGLEDGTWIGKVAGDHGRFAEAEADVSSDYRNVQEVEKAAVQRADYDTAKWAKARAKTIAQEDVLSFLSRKAVIPKYGFPVDVVELDTQRTQQNQDAFQVLLQRDLSIAISEFAPTAKLVANKKVWTSYGLKKVAEKEWDRWWYARCAKHNRFERKPWAGEGQCPPFEKCCAKMSTGKYVDPRFGFVTSRDKPQEPKGRPPKVFTTRPYFAGSQDVTPGQIPLGPVTLTTVSPGWMVVLCEGRRGIGFYVCGACGAGFRTREKAHKNPYGQPCHGTLESVSLGHEFLTDVLQIQFQREPQPNPEPVWFAYSLAYALVEGAASGEVLEVPSGDLNATVAYGSGQSPIPPIILYDNVPGGAGLVARLQEKATFQACLVAARQRVAGTCRCGESTSCYGCLRSYRNQFAHQFLQRGPVLTYLERVLSEWK
jgi:ATP-dependent helicase YprA (DUF1998 family)